MSQLKDIINSYRTGGDNLELEIRFKNITRESFVSLYNNMLKNKDFKFDIIEQSIETFIDNLPGFRIEKFTKYIRKQIFVNNTKTSDIYYKESSTDVFRLPIDAKIRLKSRASFIHNGWRFDFTLVKFSILEQIGKSLKQIKDLMFKYNNKDNFLLVDENIITDYSVEIEYIGIKKDITIDSLEIVNKLFLLIDHKYLEKQAYEEELLYLAEYLVKNKFRIKNFNNISIRNISNRAISMNKNIYQGIYPPINFYLTDKADGKRCIVSILGDRCRIITDKLELENKIKITVDTNEVTIADCEFIKSKDTVNLYVFDVMIFINKDITNESFSNRVTYIPKAVDIINRYMPKDYIAHKKSFTQLLVKDELGNKFSEVYNAKYPYVIDGLILTSPSDNYINTKSYKWKPIEHVTIDFLAKKIPSCLLGKKPYISKSEYILYALFNGIHYNMFNELGMILMPNYNDIFNNSKQRANYFPIQFSPSLDPYAYLYYHSDKLPDIDGKIVELHKMSADGEWLFTRIREDRMEEKNYYGNDFKIAEITYQNYFTKFDIEELSNPSFGYFGTPNADIYYSANKYKRFVISNVFSENLKGTWVVDLASGRGGDIHRYQELHIKNVLAIDADAEAIGELIRRKFEYSKIMKNRSKIHPMTIHAMIQDLKVTAENVIESMNRFNLPIGNIDNVVCNFALHYFCDTLQNLRNIIRLVSKLLKVDGIFIFSVLDGEMIFNKLLDININDSWKIIEDDVEKYVFKKKFIGKSLTNVGQKIEVKLPFSDKYYEESLVNIDNVIKVCGTHGLSLELNNSFNDYLENFSSTKKTLYNKLTNGDKEIIALTKYITVRKIKEVKK